MSKHCGGDPDLIGMSKDCGGDPDLIGMSKDCGGDPDLIGMSKDCGGDRIRTGVQTYPSKAFYMFIPALIVGKQQETDEPIVSLAEWS